MYQYKEVYILDFTNIQHYLEFHKIIQEELDFPDYYGKNWSALRDCLTDMVGDPLHIQIIGLDILEHKFGDTAKKLINMLRDVKHYDNDRYVNDTIIEIVEGEDIKEIL